VITGALLDHRPLVPLPLLLVALGCAALGLVALRRSPGLLPALLLGCGTLALSARRRPSPRG